MGEVAEIAAPAGWAAIGAHPDRPVAHLDLGNPHTVVGVDDVAAVDLLALGAPGARRQPRDRRAGPGADAITMRVHERGAGITEACGTGAVRRGVGRGRLGARRRRREELVVHMDGGSARVALHRPGAGRVTLTGPATYVATIEIPVP